MIWAPQAGRIRVVAATAMTMTLCVALGSPATAAGTSATAAGTSATAATSSAPAGGSGIGDPYFPLDGNSGIDVQHYDIHTGYDFDTGRLRGRTTLTLVPTSQLSSFNLDFLLPVSGVWIEGRKVKHRQAGNHELAIFPRTPLQTGTPVKVRVKYAGVPGRERYAGESNWMSDEHEVVAMNQPHMAPWWFPANDHPTDKATYDISVTVPEGNKVIANGELVSSATRGGSTRVHWSSDDPMSSYLAFFAAGKFRVDSGTHQGLPWTIAVSKQLSKRAQRSSMKTLRRTPLVVAALEADLGAYPFASTGGVVTSLDPGFALENQTRPTYPALGAGDDWLLVHELAHQWFGDSVAVSRWRDIWLNEGAASFMEQRYAEVRWDMSAQDWLTSAHRAIPSGNSFWKLDLTDPGAEKIFAEPIYSRGAMAFQALRHRVGEEAFWSLLRTWLTTKKDGHGTSEEFERLAAQVSGQDLGAFFQTWLREPTRPAVTAENGLG